MKTKALKPISVVYASLLLLLAVVFLTPLMGSQPIHWQEIWQYLGGTRTASGEIFFRIRLPRVLLAVLTGGALSLAGVVFQALLRNPLATPYTLGVSSGGALGALMAIKAGVSFSILGFAATQGAAFAGSLLTIVLVYLLSRQSGKLSMHTMILAGVTISYFFAAMILILHYLSDFTETHQMIRWMMGGLDIIDYGSLVKSLPLMGLAAAGLLSMGRTFDVLGTSEETALSKGVNVQRVQRISFVFASLLTGSVVALAGPIGFVGLIVPHLLRIFTGPAHRYLMPSAIFFGGAFLAVADTVARTIIAPVNLPVGIITAIIGGPFFLWLLFRRGRSK